MRNIFTCFLITSIALASGCATTAQQSTQARSITYDEAMAFEKAINTNEASIPKRPMSLYVQPVNKTEPCKLPTSQDQLDRINFRAYWDGQCRNGYAYGLGRDIAISDTHHVEEITVHGGNGDNYSAPSVRYDFVKYSVVYGIGGERFPARSIFDEHMRNDLNGFNIDYSVGTIDPHGHTLKVQGSPLSTTRGLINDDGNVTYRFVDNTSSPITDPSAATFVVETLESKTKKLGGIAIVRYGSGEIRHFKVNGRTPEEVILPDEFIAHVNNKYKEVLQAYIEANTNVERARQIEREYLYMACNGKHTVAGLDKETYIQICLWRDQFKAPFQEALARYTESLEQLKLKAKTAEQQQKMQEQITLQQQMIRQQQSQHLVKESMSALGQLGQKMQRSSMQMQQYFMNQPAPQAAPLSHPSSTQVNCISVGTVTNCRN